MIKAFNGYDVAMLEKEVNTFIQQIRADFKYTVQSSVAMSQYGTTYFIVVDYR